MGLNTTKHITLDMLQNNYVSVNISQYDINSREVIITLTENGTPFYVNSTDTIAYIKYYKSDFKKVLNECEITSDGKIKVEITEQMAISCCQNKAEILLIDKKTGEAIHPVTTFIVNVRKAVFSDEDISSENEFVALENALVRLEYILENLKPITKSQIDALF